MILFGIIGCSDICKKSVLPFRNNLPFCVNAIASRSLEKARRFSEENNIPQYMSSYNELLASTGVDCVYIALPPALNAQYVLAALENKKHVLVEKPMCLTSRDFDKIEKSCLKNNVYLLEGVMTKYHPWQKKIHDIIVSKQYGELKKIETRICMQIPEYMISGYRMNPELGGGVLVDEAPYWLQFLQSCIGLNICDCNISSIEYENAICFKAEISCKIGSTEVQFYCSYKDRYEANHILYFENAKLYINNFFRASMGKYKIIFRIEQEQYIEKIVFDPSNYYENQLGHFINMISQKNEDVCAQLYESRERTKWLEFLNSKIVAKNGSKIQSYGSR